MDIMNDLPEAQFNNIDDLLAFVSIYDDDNRTRAYFELLNDHVDLIKNKICLEAGCGFGLMAERMAQLGAKKVYAVEANPHLYDIAAHRLAGYKNVQVIHSDIRDFTPQETIDLLVHEFFGQLLCDEDIHVLDHLVFSPKIIMPNQAKLKMSLFCKDDLLDEVVTDSVLNKLNGALVSGLFDDEEIVLHETILEWRPDRHEFQKIIDLKQRHGDMLCMGLEVFHDDTFVCRAGDCDNWSLVWTPRAGERFEIMFDPVERGTVVHFNWL